MIINNFHSAMSIITVQVFHQYYYDEVTQVKCSLSSERWRFESIINQLVIYSLLEMATCIQNPSTRRVLPDKEAGME
jgi:hypothetical protein